jgi:hypothetical protein
VYKSYRFIKSNGAHKELHFVKRCTHIVAEDDSDLFFDKVLESPASIVVQANLIDEDVPEEVRNFTRSDDPSSVLLQLGVEVNNDNNLLLENLPNNQPNAGNGLITSFVI